MLSLCADKLRFPRTSHIPSLRLPFPSLGLPLFIRRQARSFPRGGLCLGGGLRYLEFSSSSPVIVWTRVGPVWFKFP